MHCIVSAASAAVILSCAPALAAPVDLSSWQVDGDGAWTLEAGNNGVFQSVNSRPTAFHNGAATSFNRELAGTIEVQETGGDDDWIGFVLGYDQGDIDGLNAANEFLIVDWKQGTQGGWDAGLALSRATGAIDASATNTSSEPWDHNGDIAFLTRSNAAGALYGNAGWSDRTEYQFELEYSATTLRVFVDGNLEIDVSASDFGLGGFPDGAFGFYNYSQPSVRYAGIREDPLTPSAPVPLPAALPLLGAGLAGLGLAAGRRRRR